MKKLLVLFLSVIVSCSLLADTDNYDIEWDIPTESDLEYLHLFQWEGLDTTLCPFFDNMPLTITDPLFIISINPYTGENIFQATANGGDSIYISVMAIYQNTIGNYSTNGATWANTWKNNVLTSGHFKLRKKTTTEDVKGFNQSH